MNWQQLKKLIFYLREIPYNGIDYKVKILILITIKTFDKLQEIELDPCTVNTVTGMITGGKARRIPDGKYIRVGNLKEVIV